MLRYSLITTQLLFIGFLLNAQNKKVSFEIEDFPDSVAYIGYHFGNQKYLIDTLAVSDDQFELELDEVKEGVYFIYSPQYFLEFILEDKSFRFSTSRQGGFKELEVSESVENQVFRDFQVVMGKFQQEQRQLQESLKTANEEDSVKLTERFRAIAKEMDVYKRDVIAEHPDSFMASFLKLMLNTTPPDYGDDLEAAEKRQRAYRYMSKHYFDEVDLSDPRLLRTPILHAKVIEYFDRVLVQEADSINKGIDMIFDQIGDNEELFRYWLVTLFKKYADSKVMGMDAVMVHLAKNYYLTERATWVSDEYEKQLKEEVAYLQHNLIGLQAPPLNVVDTLMQPFQIDQIASPYTLLFIYDPDCGHCKKTAKNLEERDDDLYDLDIQVLAVCTTTDVERWRKFIREHNPSWVHSIDPTGKSYFRVYYNVRSTPQVYLLDESKTILAKRLDIDQIIDLVKYREKP